MECAHISSRPMADWGPHLLGATVTVSWPTTPPPSLDPICRPRCRSDNRPQQVYTAERERHDHTRRRGPNCRLRFIGNQLKVTENQYKSIHNGAQLIVLIGSCICMIRSWFERKNGQYFVTFRGLKWECSLRSLEKRAGKGGASSPERGGSPRKSAPGSSEGGSAVRSATRLMTSTQTQVFIH